MKIKIKIFTHLGIILAAFVINFSSFAAYKQCPSERKNLKTIAHITGVTVTYIFEGTLDRNTQADQYQGYHMFCHYSNGATKIIPGSARLGRAIAPPAKGESSHWRGVGSETGETQSSYTIECISQGGAKLRKRDCRIGDKDFSTFKDRLCAIKKGVKPNFCGIEQHNVNHSMFDWSSEDTLTESSDSVF